MLTEPKGQLNVFEKLIQRLRNKEFEYSSDFLLEEAATALEQLYANFESLAILARNRALEIEALHKIKFKP